MAVNEGMFPDLVRTGYQITSPVDPIYNCISHAIGVTDAWWWPDPDGFDFWPPDVAREQSLAAFLQAFATVGYAPCSDGLLERGWQKVAVYMIDEVPAHAARQLDNGRWTSKLGPDDDIEHALQGLCGTAYGSVAAFLRRPVAQSP